MSKVTITRAQFSTVPSSGEPIPVHFNPTSLQLTVSNEMEADRQDHHQYVRKSTAKLTMDLLFDTTGKGEDVRTDSKKIENLMKPDARHVPPVAVFEWGLFKFQGLVESYRETIDFFSSDGVPLRSSINLTLAQQEQVFEDTSQGGGGGGGSGSGGGPSGGGSGGGGSSQPGPNAVDVPGGSNRSTTEMATAGGDPAAGRDIATANEEENMRFPSGAMTVDPNVVLGPPVAFASGNAGAGVSAGAGISAGISAKSGFGIGASASAAAGLNITGGIAVSATAGVTAGGSAGAKASLGGTVTGPAFGGSASAGANASDGAFAGLRVKTRTSRLTLDTSRFVQRSESAGLSTDSGARFQLGGQATLETSSSLRADVGADASLRTRIRFEED